MAKAAVAVERAPQATLSLASSLNPGRMEGEKGGRTGGRADAVRLARSSSRTTEGPQAGWLSKERLFNKKQMIDRAQLRLREGRGSAFDVLAVNTVPCGLISTEEPEQVIRGEADVPGLLESAKGALENEEGEDGRRYWEALCEYLQTLLGVGDAQGSSERPLSHTVVREDVLVVLKDKSHRELCELAGRVRSKLDSGNVLDTEYWEDLLGEIVRLQTAARLSECARVLLGRRQADSSGAMNVADAAVAARPTAGAAGAPGAAPEATLSNWDRSPASLSLYEAYARQSLEEGEVVFGEEVGTGTRVYPWAGQYVARKPRYFNSASMGIEWTKYNQAHYTADNPPAQTVQGYCFNIFYPELVDRSKVPTYRTEPDPTDPGNYQLLRFIGGAPYEDLVFRIRAFEWELGHRQDFRCTFERGVLLLRFRFRRHFYRR